MLTLINHHIIRLELMMKAANAFEMSINFYQTIRGDIPEDNFIV